MIETDRLLLRPPVLADFEPSAAMFADAAVTAHIGGAPLEREVAWTRFLRDAGHWSLYPFGLFTIIEKASGAYVGKIGYAHFQRDLGSRSTAAVEMSWTLASGFHGRGYASEAGRAAQAWFDATHALPTACLIAPANIPSLRLAERLGYREADRFVPAGRDPAREIVALVRDCGEA